MKLEYEQIKKLCDYWTLQNPDDLFWLIKKLNKLNPKVIMEIGSEWGGTIKIWDKILSDIQDNKLISLDIEYKIKIKKFESNFVSIISDSKCEDTVDKIRNVLAGQLIDFLYIDGDHGYAACKEDYEKYSQFVRPGGIIAFHDIYTERNNVGRFFNEISNKEKYQSGFIDSQGTGIIIM